MARQNLISVALSVTILDAKLARTLEPRAPRSDKRLAAAKGQEEKFIRERIAQYENPSGEPIIRTYENGITLAMRERRTPEGGFVTSQTNITELKIA
jgi:hypothetical protein